MKSSFRVLTLTFLVLAVTALSGCFKPSGPLFSLYGHQGLVMLPFDNLSQDQALGQEIQDGVSAELLKLNALPISEENKVSSFLDKQQENDINPQSNTGLRQKLAKKFKADLILTGSVETYTESSQEGAPQRLVVDSKARTYKWGYYTVNQVTATTVLKLVDSASGNLVWLKKARGVGSQEIWNDLSYPGDRADNPAEGWDNWKKHNRDHDHGKDADRRGDNQSGKDNGKTVININIQNNQQQTQQQTQSQTNNAPAQPVLLYQSDSTFSELRDGAIANCVGWLVDDFKGHNGWYPGYVAPSK